MGWPRNFGLPARLGAFLITPWVMMNYTFSGRPFRLTLIDGTNSVVGFTLMGIIFGAFGV